LNGVINMSYKGWTVLITGGAVGIGKTIAEKMVAQGAKVGIFDVKKEALEETAAELRSKGGEVLAICVDRPDEIAVEAGVDRVERELGPIEVLFNNAGGPSAWLPGGVFANLLDTEPYHWRKTVEVNLIGTMIMTWAVGKRMKERNRGSIANTASVAGVNGLPNMADYSGAKGGMIAFSKAAAIELAKYYITINCVSPGSIPTHGTAPATLLGRAGTTDDIADALIFLGSEEARFITGQNLIADGGRCLSLRAYDYKR
jgi:NAD(P)-dependent dehydrogenase (short-subunit alcohol dehydrogenase family)